MWLDTVTFQEAIKPGGWKNSEPKTANSFEKPCFLMVCLFVCLKREPWECHPCLNMTAQEDITQDSATQAHRHSEAAFILVQDLQAT